MEKEQFITMLQNIEFKKITYCNMDLLTNKMGADEQYLKIEINERE